MQENKTALSQISPVSGTSTFDNFSLEWFLLLSFKLSPIKRYNVNSTICYFFSVAGGGPSTSSASSQTMIGIAVGCAVGGVAVIISALALIMHFYAKKTSKQEILGPSEVRDLSLALEACLKRFQFLMLIVILT